MPWSKKAPPHTHTHTLWYCMLTHVIMYISISAQPHHTAWDARSVILLLHASNLIPQPEKLCASFTVKYLLHGSTCCWGMYTWWTESYRTHQFWDTQVAYDLSQSVQYHSEFFSNLLLSCLWCNTHRFTGLLERQYTYDFDPCYRFTAFQCNDVYVSVACTHKMRCSGSLVYSDH